VGKIGVYMLRAGSN